MSKCKECSYYSLYKMVISGRPYNYSGDIPCTKCKHFKTTNDEFVSASKEIDRNVWNGTDWKQINLELDDKIIKERLNKYINWDEGILNCPQCHGTGLVPRMGGGKPFPCECSINKYKFNLRC